MSAGAGKKGKKTKSAAPSLERDLAVGGVCSATGLYVSYLATKQLYRTTRWIADVVVPETPPPTSYVVTRPFMGYRNNTQALIARDEVLGGAMLLTRCGIFYVAAPSYRILELRNGADASAVSSSLKTSSTSGGWADWWTGAASSSSNKKPAAAAASNVAAKEELEAAKQKLRQVEEANKQINASKLAQSIQHDAAARVRLPPHAYYLFLSALTWVPRADLLSVMNPQLAARERQFGDECLLQMVLSDLRQRLACRQAKHAMSKPIQDAMQYLLMRFTAYTKPASWAEYAKRVFYLATPPRRPTALSLWQDFDAHFGNFFKREWLAGDAQFMCKSPFFQRMPNETVETSSDTVLGTRITTSSKQLELRFKPSSKNKTPDEDAKLRTAGAPFDIGPAWDAGELVYIVLRT